MRKTCELCEGTGRVMESEKLHTHYCNTLPARQTALPGSGVKPLELERALGYFLFLTLVGYASFILFREKYEVSGWPKIAVALMASVILLFVLNHFSAATRFLRWFTLIFFLMVVCGGVALEFVHS